jgi:hypothetical protein
MAQQLTQMATNRGIAGTLNLQPSTFDLQPWIPQPSTFNTEPSILEPEP